MRRTGWTTLVATIAATAFAGCGGGTTSTTSTTTRGTVDPAALRAVASGSERLQDAGSAHFTLDGRFTIQDESIPIHSSGSMTISGAPRGRLDQTMRIPGPSEGHTTELDVETRIIGDQLYMRMPEEAVEDPARPWRVQTMPPEMMQASDPSFQARVMRYATAAERIGPERVGGVRTTRYRVTVDYGALAKSGPASMRKLAEAMIAADIDREQTSEVWIDGDGVPRRLHAEVTTGDHEVASTIDIRIDDLGVPVHVEAPPADQVTEESATQPTPS